MTYRKLLFIGLSLIVSTPSVLSQSSKESKVSDNSVWYNARRGEPSAMNQVGVWYYSGNKVKRDYDEAFRWWSRAALQQNAKSIANLGICYQYGRGVERDSLQAIRLYVTAIENGQTELLEQRKVNTPNNTFDDMLVAFCYERGVGCLRDLDKASSLYASAADRGSVEGMKGAARTLLEVGVPLESLKYWERAAKQGDMYATYMVGKMRLGNMGVAQDNPTAYEYLRKAAEAGVPEAQAELGKLYLNGGAVVRDIQQALHWLQLAAYAGNADGMWHYGNALKANNDFDAALFWMAQAANASYGTEFKAMLNSLPSSSPFMEYVEGYKYLIDGNAPRAQEYFRSMSKAKGNDGKVMEAYAQIKQGEVSKAVKQLQKVSADSPQAAYVLAEVFFRAIGMPRDVNAAMTLYKHAAANGYGPAQDKLGDIYYEGEYVTQDLNTALNYYKGAFAQRRLGETGAERMLQMYEQGIPGIDAALAQRVSLYDPTDVVAAVLK